MSEQQPIPGVLVSGLPGHDSQPLTTSEYEMLLTCLEFYRSDSKELYAIAAAVHAAGHSNEKYPERRTLMWFLKELCGNIGEHCEENDAMLTQDYKEPIFLHEPRTYDCEFNETESLAAFLTVLRAGGWLAGWLDIQVRCFADRKSNPPPTPTQLMHLLTLAAAEFEEKLSNARHVLNNHWDALGFPGTTPPDPAAYEPQEPPAPVERVTDPRIFQLTMVDAGDVKEPANLTRREFQELKKHLATMRAKKAGKGKKAA